MRNRYARRNFLAIKLSIILVASSAVSFAIGYDLSSRRKESRARECESQLWHVIDEDNALVRHIDEMLDMMGLSRDFGRESED